MTQQLPTQTFEPVPPLPQRKPKVPFTKRRWFLPVALGAVLLLGVGLGAGDPRTVEVTKEVPVEVEKIVEKEVEVTVPVTPQACLDVIDNAGKIIAVSIAIQDAQSDALTAVGNSDVAGINAATEKVKAQNAVLDELTAPWKESIDGCRAG